MKSKLRAPISHWIEHQSVMGTLILCANEDTLVEMHWSGGNFMAPNDARQESTPFLKEVATQLDQYLASERQIFELSLAPHGTEFQQQAWNELCKIPFGQTISYQEQATRLGDKNKMRAVGGANGKNPIPIIIPCHRVIGKSGKLHGFSAGLDRKAYLLRLEKAEGVDFD